MSWWVSLNDKNGNPLKVASFVEGGTIVVGGSREADLNITYNYGPLYYEHLDVRKGLRWLSKKTGADTYNTPVGNRQQVRHRGK